MSILRITAVPTALLACAAIALGTSDLPTRPPTEGPDAATPAGAPFATPNSGAPAAPDGCVAQRFQAIIETWYANVRRSDNSSSEDGFTVAWRGPQQQSGTMKVPAGSIESRGLPSGPNFRDRVRAFNSPGESGWSNWAAATSALTE
jgi:hypothetical protein